MRRQSSWRPPSGCSENLMATATERTAETVELLQALIRNECVNDGTPESGQEVRNADLLATYLEGTGLDL